MVPGIGLFRAVTLVVLLSPLGSTEAAVELIKGARPASAGPADRVYVLAGMANEARTLALSEELSSAGARVLHVILPDIIVCDLPKSVDFRSIVSGGGAEMRFANELSGIDRDRFSVTPSTIERRMREARAPRERGPAPIEYRSRDAAIAAVEARERETRWPSPATSSRGGTADRLVHQNSDILAGRILVQVVFPESEANLEDWTDAARDDAFSAVVAAIGSFQDEFRNADITAVYRRVEDAATSYEPITRTSQIAGEKSWVSDVMVHLGYTGTADDYIDMVHQFNNDGRNQYKTDWVFTVFIVNAQRDADHMFAQARIVGWGYIGGPHIVTPYPAGFLGQPGMARLIKREIGHVFWALDEQVSSEHTCGHRSGYLNGDNGNRTTTIDPIAGPLGCRPGVIPDGCIMNSADAYDYGVDSFCKFSAIMLGISDVDNNNVPDAFESAPRVSFSSAAAETLVAPEEPQRADVLPLKFQAISVAVPNRNSRQPPNERLDYAVPVKDVAISVQGSPQVFFPPLDGKADELAEDFEVKLPRLAPGLSTIDITTRNVYGAKSPIQKKSIFLISLEFFNFVVDYERTGLRVNWSMRGETFGASFDLRRRNVETGEDDLVAGGLQPIGPTRNEITPYSGFDKAVVPGIEYEYYVVGKFNLVYKGASTPFEFRSNPVELIGPFARTDMLSLPAPNPFTAETFVSVSIPSTFTQAEGQSYEIRVPTRVSVAVFDVAGRRIKEIFRDNVFENVVTVGWDGTNSRGKPVPLGVYFIKAEAGENTGFKKVLLVR